MLEAQVYNSYAELFKILERIFEANRDVWGFKLISTPFFNYYYKINKHNTTKFLLSIFLIWALLIICGFLINGRLHLQCVKYAGLIIIISEQRCFISVDKDGTIKD